MSTGVLVLAAGTGSRLGQELPKAFVTIGDKPMVRFSLESVQAAAIADHVLLVVAAAEVQKARAMVSGLSHLQVDDVVAGGDTRQASVQCGLVALPTHVDLVLCHDAARPFASPALFRRVAEAVRSSGAGGAVPMISSPDTVKRIAEGRVVETIPRHTIGLVQTPQAFDAGILRRAHEQGLRDGVDATDDAMLLEAIGSPVVVVEGEAANFKVTTPEDLQRAEGFVSRWQGARDG